MPATSFPRSRYSPVPHFALSPATTCSARQARFIGSFNFNLSDKIVEREQRPWLAREKCMSRFAMRLLTLTMYATASVMFAPAEAAASKKHRHHQQSIGISNHWYGGQARPAGPSGPVCPGLARSFDCRVWPPPFDEDPDRKASGTDSG